MHEIELKPCPFCGSHDVSMSFSAMLDSPEPAHRMVECEQCGAMGESFKIEKNSVAIDGDDRFAQGKAIAAWNTRTAASARGVADGGECILCKTEGPASHRYCLYEPAPSSAAATPEVEREAIAVTDRMVSLAWSSICSSCDVTHEEMRLALETALRTPPAPAGETK